MFRMYIDETGNADLGASNNPDHRFLSLTGIIADQQHMAKIAIPEVHRIKTEILEFDPDEIIPLHRKELMQKKYPFNILHRPGKEAAFNQAILKLLDELPYTVITVVIDKLEHLRKYRAWQADPYHYCLKILFERCCLILNSKRSSGDVMCEARGKRENERLVAAYEELHDYPSPIRSDVLKRCLPSKKLKVRQKSQNIAGLQLADLIAHPSAMHVRNIFNNEPQQENFGAQVVKILRDKKYHRHWYKGITGYGVKWLP